uniref:Major facilitator superfamily (MFS) profile domain-containing protein n=1 Tax=Globodera rostochiensis TaxID=31243 RepID=A0A914GY17_GLORO
MDRFTIAGILNDVQNFYRIDDTMAGFLQTVFIISFMTVAPICGFLGDRFNRKRIMLIGLSIWVGAVFASSFITENHFWAFLLFRCIVGIGEASYAVIAPTLIADLFVGKLRSRVLMFFYFAIPVGSGLGYVVGSYATLMARRWGASSDCLDCWQWGIRVTPVLGLFCIVNLMLFVQEPVRGQAEQNASQNVAEDLTAAASVPTTYETVTISPNLASEQQSEQIRKENYHRLRHYVRSYGSDVGYLITNRTFLWSTLGYTAVVFVTGTLAWWGPTAIEHAKAMEEHLNDTSKLDLGEKNQISIIFGAITCLAGIFGVSAGSLLAHQWKTGKFCFVYKPTERADALISAVGSFAAAPLMFIAFTLITKSQNLSWFVVFLTILCLCLNWAVNVDMLMSITVPQRRSIACAMQILLSHLFGDATGPYLVGAISDFVRGNSKLPADRFRSLIVAFYLPNALLLLSGVAFIGAAYALPMDLARVKRQMAELKEDGRGTTPSTSATNGASSSNCEPQGRQNDAFE